MAQVNPSPGEAQRVGTKRSLYGTVRPGQWTTGLCDCGVEEEIVVGPGEALDDEQDIMVAMPPVMYSRLAHKFRGDNITLACLTYACCWLWVGWAMAKGLRGKLREKYNLPEEPYGDCVVHLCCSPFAVFQEYREMEAREGIKFWAGGDAHARGSAAAQQPQQQQQQPAAQTSPPEQQEVTPLSAM
mmetsp:Transcript_37077/g.109323  ORF Transcript_37077/g.109323 Transcript_37077/m.109323 type:complete len:186 (-) Transcript_37077:429-986(-)